MIKYQAILNELIKQDILNENCTLIGVMDNDALKATADNLIASFSSNFYHTFAVKANSLIEVLKNLRAFGIGAEVASAGELRAALKAGYQAQEIIFDSPCKTIEDLEDCIKNDIAINIDNLQELARVDNLFKKYPNTKSIIGFRINAQIGTGKIESTSTATATSKFGYPIVNDGSDENPRQKLIDIYKSRPWLTSIHTHSGSQGVDISLMVNGIKVIVDLANEINQLVGNQQISRVDIGGGLPVNFSSEEVTPSFEEYATILKKEIPELFSDKFQVKTEFGRAIVAKNGFIATRVEYTKNMGSRHIATTHAGAQVLTRTAFLSSSWPLRVSIYDANGRQRTPDNSDVVTTDVAGPCCFAGDLICKKVELPEIQVNDYVVIHDTGGYYFSNHFDYNCFPRIAIYEASYNEQENKTNIRTIRHSATIDDVVNLYAL